MLWPMSERRMQSRRPTRHQVSLFVGSGDDMLPFGHTRDLSVSGVFVRTAARPPVNSHLSIGLVWGEDSLICTAQVIRHDADGIGLTFMDPDPDFARAIAEILDSSPRIEVVVNG